MKICICSNIQFLNACHWTGYILYGDADGLKGDNYHSQRPSFSQMGSDIYEAMGSKDA